MDTVRVLVPSLRLSGLTLIEDSFFKFIVLTGVVVGGSTPREGTGVSTVATDGSTSPVPGPSPRTVTPYVVVVASIQTPRSSFPVQVSRGRPTVVLRGPGHGVTLRPGLLLDQDRDARVDRLPTVLRDQVYMILT